jgi:hypothetical protein
MRSAATWRTRGRRRVKSSSSAARSPPRAAVRSWSVGTGVRGLLVLEEKIPPWLSVA